MYMVIMVADQIPVHKPETFGHFATVTTMLKIRLSRTDITYEHTYIRSYGQTEGRAGRRAGRQADRQTGRQTNRQTNRQTDILKLHHIT